MERPHLRYIEAGGIAPTPSIAAVTAPGKALGQFGEVLSGLGDKGLKIATQIRESEEKGKLSTWRARSSERMATFSDNLLQRQDFQNWEADAEKELTAIGAEIDSLKLSPVAEASAKEYFTGWASEKRIALGSQVASRTFSEGRLRSSKAAAYHASRGEMDEARAAIDQGEFDPAERTAMHLEVDREGQLHRYYRSISERPREAAAQLADPAFLKKNPTLTSGDQSDLAAQAHHTQRTQAYTAVEEALGPIGRTLRTAGDFLSKFSTRLSPVAIGSLAAGIGETVTADIRRQRATPQYAQQVTGEVSAMLGTYQPDAEDFDENYAKMAGLTRTLPEGPARSRLEGQLQDIRDGRHGLIRDNYDLAKRDLLQAYQDGRFGDISARGTASVTLRQALDDGLLLDRDKLQRLGFTAEQTRDIATFGDEKFRIQNFRKFFDQRTGVDQTTPLERAAYLALRDGQPHSTLIEVPDADAMARKQEGLRQAQTILGRTELKLHDYYTANPKASAADIRAETKRITDEEVRQLALRKTMNAIPAGKRSASTTGQASSNSR